MNTRMEKVTKDVVLTAARKAGADPQSALDQQTFEAAFQAVWPIPDSVRPMNDAINTAAQAASSFTAQDSNTWETTLTQFWRPAVQEVVDEYLSAARHSFRKGESLEGSEILTDAVRATLGSIAASRNWPHSTEEDLFSTAAALGSGTSWPQSTEDFSKALSSRSKEGRQLGSALGASMGLPESITFGTYQEDPERAEENGLSFAETVLELANHLAGPEPAIA